MYLIVETNQYGWDGKPQVKQEEELMDKLCRFFREFDEIAMYSSFEEAMKLPNKIEIMSQENVTLYEVTFENFHQIGKRLCEKKKEAGALGIVRSYELAQEIIKMANKQT